jgi:hypothetical protein
VHNCSYDFRLKAKHLDNHCSSKAQQSQSGSNFADDKLLRQLLLVFRVALGVKATVSDDKVDLLWTVFLLWLQFIAIFS